MSLQAKIPLKYKYVLVHFSPHIMQAIAFIRTISINGHLIIVKNAFLLNY